MPRTIRPSTNVAYPSVTHRGACSASGPNFTGSRLVSRRTAGFLDSRVRCAMCAYSWIES